MLTVPRFYHIHRISGAKIVAARGHLEVKNCTKIYLRRAAPWILLRELTALPRTPSWCMGRGLAAPPKNHTLLRPFGTRLTIYPPLEKSCWRPWSSRLKISWPRPKLWVTRPRENPILGFKSLLRRAADRSEIKHTAVIACLIVAA